MTAEQCKIERCEKAAGRGNGMCHMHYTRQWRHGSPHAMMPRGGAARPGERHHMWRGDNPSYDTAHARIRRDRGRASNFDCVDCRNPAKHWSYNNASQNELIADDGRRYSADPAEYEPRCVKCHALFDLAERPIPAAPPGEPVCVVAGCLGAAGYGWRGHCGRHYAALRRQGHTRHQSGQAIRQHVEALRAAGWTLRGISREARVNRGSLTRLVTDGEVRFLQATVERVLGLPVVRRDGVS